MIKGATDPKHLILIAEFVQEEQFLYCPFDLRLITEAIRMKGQLFSQIMS